MTELKVFLHSSHRKLTLQAKSPKDFFVFTFSLNSHLQRYKKEQMEYRYNSFAPVRYNNDVEFFVDGSEYFEAMGRAIDCATETVFICGWWVSPEFMLVRSR
jgi:phosphatidylserine/phosphatidylglycerophosphate/cardiolipin synthase-like enzyme